MENNSTPVQANEEQKPTQIWNRDINTLASVMYSMQDILRIEEMQQWQQERMTNISARIDGTSGGSGTAKGLDEAFAKLSELDEEYAAMCKSYADTTKAANEILHSITSPSMRSFVILKYMLNMPDIKVRKALNMSRRSLEQAKECIENAACMAEVEWKERYILPMEDFTEEKS